MSSSSSLKRKIESVDLVDIDKKFKNSTYDEFLDKLYDSVWGNLVIRRTIFIIMNKTSIIIYNHKIKTLELYNKNKQKLELYSVKLFTSLENPTDNVFPTKITRNLITDTVNYLEIVSDTFISKNTLPNSIQTLVLKDKFNRINLFNLPTTIEILKLWGNTKVYYNLQEGEEVSKGSDEDSDNESDDGRCNDQKGEEVSKGSEYIGNQTYKEDHFFKSLKTIMVNSNTSNVFDFNYLFPKLEIIYITGLNRNYQINLNIPPSVTNIIFTEKYTDIHPNIPETVKSVEFGCSGIQIDLEKIPFKIENINIKKKIDYKLDDFKNFKNLKTLSFFQLSSDYDKLFKGKDKKNKKSLSKVYFQRWIY